MSAPTSKSKAPVSPLAPATFPQLPVIPGLRLSALAVGVRYKGRTDVMLAVADPGATVAGVFTRSATRSAPVLDCQAKLAAPEGTDQGVAIVVNSGNSNAFTGARGTTSVQAICQATSDATGLPVSRIFTASTGVIGEPLPHDRITSAMPDLVAALSPDALRLGAEAIMTTDTYAKGATVAVDLGGTSVQIAGIAKGSGMIAPDMATMLVYIFTDAAVEQPVLQAMLSKHCDATFNATTVDSDTSTSDSLMLVATGKTDAPRITDIASADGQAFSSALHGLMLDLAHQVVRDGEGATKFVEVSVTGAADAADARRVSKAIADSPLVKTAIAGEDPNWGRIVMAIGKSGARVERDLISIHFGPILVAEKGWVAESYTEADGAAYMKRQDLVIHVALGMGSGSDTMWTCDLTHQYITINADYRS